MYAIRSYYGRRVAQQFDHRNLGRAAGKDSAHLAEIGPVATEVGEKDDHTPHYVGLDAKATSRETA